MQLIWMKMLNEQNNVKKRTFLHFPDGATYNDICDVFTIMINLSFMILKKGRLESIGSSFS